MLALRPNCEWCDKDLPPDASDAMICSYECTYCADCVENVLKNVCPTCGGNFSARPIRPKGAHRSTKTLGLGHHPAQSERVHSPYTREEVDAMVAKLSHITPEDR